MTQAGKHWYQTQQPDHLHHRIQLKRNPGENIWRQLKHKSVGEEIQKDGESAAPEKFDSSFGEMALASLFRCFFLCVKPPRLGRSGIVRAPHDLFVHPIQRARNLVGDSLDLEVLHHFLDLGGYAVAPPDRLTKRDRFANHFEISSARTAIMEFRGRFRATLGTEHMVYRCDKLSVDSYREQS